MSDVQESAQYMAGNELPQLLLNGLLSGSGVPKGSTVLVCNLTPYDCCLERVALGWELANADNPGRMKILSLSSRTAIIDYCSRSLAMDLLKDI